MSPYARQCPTCLRCKGGREGAGSDPGGSGGDKGLRPPRLATCISRCLSDSAVSAPWMRLYIAVSSSISVIRLALSSVVRFS